MPSLPMKLSLAMFEICSWSEPSRSALGPGGLRTRRHLSTCFGLSLGSERRRATLERGAPSGANSASLPRGGLETPPQDGANPNPNPSQPCHPRRQAAPGRRLRHSPPALSQLEAEHKVFSLELRLWLEAEQLQSVDLRPGDRVSITVKLRVLGLGFGMRRTRL